MNNDIIHCISKDYKLSKGFAKQINYKFDNRNYLENL